MNGKDLDRAIMSAMALADLEGKRGFRLDQADVDRLLMAREIYRLRDEIAELTKRAFK